jgi:hypothetical protein
MVGSSNLSLGTYSPSCYLPSLIPPILSLIERIGGEKKERAQRGKENKTALLPLLGGSRRIDSKGKMSER